jgi:hypothetical protein
MCQGAGVDFYPIDNRPLALIQAFKAMLVGLWMVVDLLEKNLKSEFESGSTKDEQNT